MKTDTQLYSAIAYIIFFVVLAYYYKKYPPKKINWLYGYRTRRSMANQKVWDAANKFSSKVFYTWQLYFLVFPILVFFLFPEYNFIVTVLAHTLLILATIPATEIYLDKYFDKNGNPK